MTNPPPIQALREKILGIVHLVGCQTYTAGYNEKLDGKDAGLTEVERLEEITTTELILAITKYVEGVIGVDEPMKTKRQDKWQGSAPYKRNQLRAEQRRRAGLNTNSKGRQ